MFSPSVAGGSICIGCQLRAVTRRATPAIAASAQARPQSRVRRRRFASEATGRQEEDLVAILTQQSHNEKARSRRPISSRKQSTKTQKENLDETPIYDAKQPSHAPARAPARPDSLPETESLQDGDADAGTVGDSLFIRERTGHESKQLPKPKANAYRKGNTLLREDRARLSVAALGKEAEIIVLREGGEWKRRIMKEEIEAADEDLGIEEHIDQEEGLSLDIVLENIDELRPQHRILPTNEFKRVLEDLMKGFTVPQLHGYVQRHRQRLADGDESPFFGVLPELLKPQPWTLEQTQWTPETPNALQDVDPQLRGYILKSMRHKQRLTMQLMRECWGISAQELMDGPGVLELRIRDPEFKLLTLGAQRWLQNICRVHLGDGPGRSIQVVRSKKMIRIVAPKGVAEVCLSAINETLQKMKTKRFKLESNIMEKVSTSMIEDLSKATNTAVELNKDQKELIVTWIHIRSETESALEDSGDVVFRLLQATNASVRTGKTLAIYPNTKGKGRLVDAIGGKEKLSWSDRHQRWARLCLPLNTEAPQIATSWPLDESIIKYKVQATPEDLILPTSTLKAKHDEFYKSLAGVPLTFPRAQEKVVQPAPTEPTPSSWLPFRVRTNAVFGHILHLNDDSVAQDLNSKTPDNVDPSSSPRALHPLIPPLAGMQLPGWVPYKSPPSMTSLVLLRFSPYSENPSQPPDPLAPHLELRIKATDEEIIEIDSLRAISHTHVSDILLPTEQVDIRVTQRLVAELPREKIYTLEAMAPLVRFLDDARLEVHRGKLVTPPRLENLALPMWMFYQPEDDADSPFLSKTPRRRAPADPTKASRPRSSKSRTSKSKTTLEPLPAYTEAHRSSTYNALRPISYTFSGLELHRPVNTTFNGWCLNYTSIEAGQGGRRRAELSLDAVPSGDRQLRRDADSINTQQYLRSIYTLARGLEGNLMRTKDAGKEVRTTIRWLGAK
ncbi:hypothetical protein M406DRAFT_71789 [Cryphonectria parasitica EP155]|uniref:Uncharacterized protein n=1 Tax=Cryphonectria parasitica (strain ATCC 38755 / EP155) TaxID=660469 RepID=A0A9P5CT60_CRYP1|nr:uncharacterized protein M406DRAFT_71789 [Cryphonectria parasitica EP155]KAF3768815.1 hypothetical protein M406DRAFT_71789 [Cryphonectria parasitica EP155]